jgi:hypothetical protein
MRSDKGNVMIPYDLLTDLCRYHLAGVVDPEIEGRIRAGLQAKMNSTAARERYTAELRKETNGRCD